jgi:replication factor C subunit 2/4
MNESWVEKFRPNNLDEIQSQEDIIMSLKNCIKTKNIPHLLFFGPSGCGKTSTILALAKEIFGEKYWSDRVIELNASDERGIKVVREKIKRYAMNSVSINPNIPPWKIIILDEADNMTSDSQFALRKIMEDYSKVTRFCIICNYHNKIIDPIVSRCSLYRFKPIPKENIHFKLKDICEKEASIIDNKSVEMIEKISRGDLRKAINFLQRCRNFKNLINNVDDINLDLIETMSGIIPHNILNDFIDECIKSSSNDNSSKVDKMIDDFYQQSYSLTIMIPYIIDIIIKHKKLNDNVKSLLVQKVLSIDNFLLNGCDENIQYNRLAYSIMHHANDNKNISKANIFDGKN